VKRQRKTQKKALNFCLIFPNFLQLFLYQDIRTQIKNVPFFSKKTHGFSDFSTTHILMRVRPIVIVWQQAAFN
jgi:hypothetical protein